MNDTTRKIYPKPCERCGADATICYDPPPIPRRYFDWHVHCADLCQENRAQMGWGETREAAINDWNTLHND